MIDARDNRVSRSTDLKQQWETHRIPVLAAFMVNLLAFGYLFFTYIYTNHTFPNILQQGSPSFRTVLEGRWGADLIYLLQGRRGIPLFDLMLAVPVQIANGILFARLLGLRDPLPVFLSASLISVHPFVSDYYAFGGDHLVLVLGDTAILAAFLLVREWRRTGWATAAAAVLIQFGLSCYQPKIGLAATLWVLLLLAAIARWDGTHEALRRDMREMLWHAVVIASAAALYMALLKLSQWWLGNPAADSPHSLKRLAINHGADFLLQAGRALILTQDSLLEADLFGTELQILPGLMLALLALLAGGRALSRAANRRDRNWVLLLLLLSLGLLPFAMHASHLISIQTYDAGRIMMPTVYLSAFLPLMLLAITRPRPLRIAVLVVAFFMCYRFVIASAEAGHLAHLRSLYEMQFANRLTSRIEPMLADTPRRRPALVVVGRRRLPAVLKPSIRTRSNLNEQSFVSYREVEMLNFLLGRDVLAFPNEAQTKRALDYAARHPVWPAKESVALLGDDLVVVVMERPHENVVTTMVVP